MGAGKQRALDPSAIAVVDCETTGLHPGRHHRIIELAIVSLGEDWEPNDVWCTLLKPERDLGPTGIHGIRGRDVRDAPTFDAVLGEVIDRLAGRVVVAHNARFDCGFLEYELARGGDGLAAADALHHAIGRKAAPRWRPESPGRLLCRRGRDFDREPHRPRRRPGLRWSIGRMHPDQRTAVSGGSPHRPTDSPRELA